MWCFAKARKKARISMWSRGSSLFMGLESSENGCFPPFRCREQKQKIGRFRDRKARKNSFLQRSNSPCQISHDPPSAPSLRDPALCRLTGEVSGLLSAELGLGLVLRERDAHVVRGGGWNLS